MKQLKYIQPITKIYKTFNEAKDDVDKFGHSFVFEDKKSLTLSDLAQGTRNLVVGEPGVGKSELLKRFQEHHDSEGDQTCLVNLRGVNVIGKIDDFLKKKVTGKKVLLLDALDEVKASSFAEVLEKIQIISENNPEIILYLSSRWIFISKYSVNFPEFRFIRILPFTVTLTKKYLIEAGSAEKDVDALIARIMQFGHGKIVVQIPRYLSFLVKFIKDRTISNVSSIQRNELFEYFIYSELEVEDKKLNTDSKLIIKRILEKLALAMEIYQTNTITKDELMTFFDDVDSDLKLTVLSHITLETFFAKTILQESKDDLDSIEFQNTEFQEYLAAKEITRFPEPHRAVFSFATDENIEEVLPSWFNTLTFLVDMAPELIEQLLEFSGLRTGKFKIADEGFLNFLARINPKTLSVEFRQRIFWDVVNYYQNTKQWISGNIADALPGFFSTPFEAQLKEIVEKSEIAKGSNRYVPLGNISYVVAYLFGAGVALDKPYWRAKLLSYVVDDNDNGVLQRLALVGLEKLGDKTVVDELPDLSEIADELIAREFVSACIELNPNHPRSVQFVIETVKRNDIGARYGLFEITEKDAIKTFLEALINDDKFRKEFLDDTSIFGERDAILVQNIAKVLDTDLQKLCLEAIVKCVQTHSYRSADRSVFVINLVKLLKEKTKGFLKKFLKCLKDDKDHALYFAQDTLVQILEKKDIKTFLEIMIQAGESRTAVSTMIRIKYSSRPSSEEIFETGRSLLPTEYDEWEKAQLNQTNPHEEVQNQRMLDEFRTHLNPAPDKYSTGVFHYYVHSNEKLDSLLENKDKDRLRELITGSVLKFNPAEHGLTIESQHHDQDGGGTKTYRSSQIAHMFGDALLSAQKIGGVDLTPFRKNIALYIPFAYNNQLSAIFEMVPDFTQEELAPVIQIYKDRETDLWRHQPESFIDLVQKYHLSEALPILKSFAKESTFRSFLRCETLRVIDSLVPDKEFLEEIFELYIKSENEREIAYVANGLLITNHADKKAVTWRIEEIIARAFPFISPVSGHVHTVGPREDELQHDKPFAKPLSELKFSGFEDEYLNMLEKAMDIWNRGKDFHAYASYMWEIVFNYFGNLKEERTYGPLKVLEQKISSFKEKDGANWLASRIVPLRRTYLEYLGKPKNFSEAVRKYNEARKFDDKNIRNSSDLFHHLQDVIQTDLRNWVEYEGAYNIIVSKKKYKENVEYEKLVQMTIKSEINSICRGRGFKIDLAREEQLIDGKRTDFIVRYGFVGPIVLEVKLSSNSDLKKRKIENSKSYASMTSYMKGYGASHGIFLIMDDTGKPHVQRAKETFGKIPNVIPLILDCYTPAMKKVVKKTVKKKPIKKPKNIFSPKSNLGRKKV